MITIMVATMTLTGFILGIEAFVFAYLEKASMLGKVRKILLYSLIFVMAIFGLVLQAVFNIEFSEMYLDKTKYHIMLICVFLCVVVPMLLIPMVIDKAVRKQEENPIPLTALVAMALMSFICGIEIVMIIIIKNANVFENREKILLYVLIVISAIITETFMVHLHSNFKEMHSDKIKTHTLHALKCLCTAVPILLVAVTTGIAVLK